MPKPRSGIAERPIADTRESAPVDVVVVTANHDRAGHPGARRTTRIPQHRANAAPAPTTPNPDEAHPASPGSRAQRAHPGSQTNKQSPLSPATRPARSPIPIRGEGPREAPTLSRLLNRLSQLRGAPAS